MDKQEMSIRNSILLCIEKGVKGAQSQLDSFDKNKRLGSKYQIDALQKNLECICKNVLIEGSGVRGKVTLSEFYSELQEREDGRADSGYKENDTERMMRHIITNEIIKGYKKLEKYEYGLSNSGWATFLGIESIDETESFEVQASEYLEKAYGMKANEFFKPVEIVNEFQKAHAVTIKGVIGASFSREERIQTESFYNAGIPDKKGHISFKIITKEEYEEMKETREDVLKANGSSVSEYLGNIKKNKSERMKEIFKIVENALMEKYGATRFHESIKVEILDIENERAINLFEPVSRYFYEHFIERSITYRNNNKTQYQNSTYFWRRFYYMNTCHLLEFIDRGQHIDTELLEQQKKSYIENLESYLYDFDVTYYMLDQIKSEGGGFFGQEIVKEAEKRHYERLASMKLAESEEKIDIVEQLDGFFDASEEKETIIEEVEVMKKAQVIQFRKSLSDSMKEELDWMERMSESKRKTKKSELLEEEEVEYSIYMNVKGIDIAEHLANTPPLKGFGWEIEQREREMTVS